MGTYQPGQVVSTVRAENTQVYDFPTVPPRLDHMPTLHAVQEWEGYVVEIHEGSFTARLADLTSGETYASEEADIPIEELSRDDASKMQVGSVFRMVIGKERAPWGTQKSVLQIVFRDLPAFTSGDLSAADELAQERLAAFQLD